ncbi:RNA polymerase sigma factor [Chitinophaga pendula]|uniref:RNA polymerase sigma factor n=1 Tax=Chitinophaga TaxID=79328 RepID=UPI000BAFACE3|nr:MULTISPECIES: RNA polymerase sigma factor [Chitinophaga]ASZ14523.1 hypothetical protein CK934_28030 [Chitinophaga sp. MD30]UCJ07821.1 RNA polymerase sigma factor [Chitinophaga pendula]
MTKNDIFKTIDKDPRFRKACQLVATESEADDLYQEVVLILLQLPEDKLLQLSGSCLYCYFARIVVHEYCSSRSKYHRKYRKDQLPLNRDTRGVIDALYSDQPDDENLHDDIASALRQLNERERQMIELYAELGSTRKVSEKTKIPVTTVHTALVNARKVIKSHLNKSL